MPQEITKHSARLQITYLVNDIWDRQFSHSLQLSASIENLLFTGKMRNVTLPVFA